MASHQDDVQPVQDQCRETDPSWSQEESPEQHIQDQFARLPEFDQQKSFVGNATAPTMELSGRFRISDTVHMSVIQDGARKKGIFQVREGRWSRSGWWEYQLVDDKGNLHENGAWVREKDLKSESRRG